MTQQRCPSGLGYALLKPPARRGLLAHEQVDTVAVTGGLSSAPGRGGRLHDGRPAAGVLRRPHAHQLLQQPVAQRQRLLRGRRQGMSRARTPESCSGLLPHRQCSMRRMDSRTHTLDGRASGARTAMQSGSPAHLLHLQRLDLLGELLHLFVRLHQLGLQRRVTSLPHPAAMLPQSAPIVPTVCTCTLASAVAAAGLVDAAAMALHGSLNVHTRCFSR
jgi:hypothetical protein